MDHSISNSPPALVKRFGYIAGRVASAGADAVIVHKGRIRLLLDIPETRDIGLIVHLSAGTELSRAEHCKVLVASVEEAAALGADAVSVHINLGADSEPEQLRDTGVVARECMVHGMPFLVMAYVRGSTITNTAAAQHLVHAVNVAVDLGADVVKTDLPRPLGDVNAVIEACAAPLIFSGGSEGTNDDLIATARNVMSLGGAGFAVGRRAWTQPDPAVVVSSLRDIIHGQRMGEVRQNASAASEVSA